MGTIGYLGCKYTRCGGFLWAAHRKYGPPIGGSNRPSVGLAPSSLVRSSTKKTVNNFIYTAVTARGRARFLISISKFSTAVIYNNTV